MHITPLIRIQTIAKLDSVGITSDCVCPEDPDDIPSVEARGRSRRSMKIEDKDKIKETARIILDPENDKIPDSVVRMRTERIDITPLARSRSPAIKVSQPSWSTIRVRPKVDGRIRNWTVLYKIIFSPIHAQKYLVDRQKDQVEEFHRAKSIAM